MGAFRFRNGKADVATDTYTKGGRHVVLFGVSHVSDYGFWTRLNTYLAETERKGFQVQYERIKVDTASAPRIVPNYKLLADLLGLQFQGEGLELQSSWENTDVALSRLLRDTTPEVILQMTKRSESMDEKLQSILELRKTHPEQFSLARKSMLASMRTAPLVVPFLMKSGLTILKGVDNRDIVELRNQVAVDSILGTDRDVVALWGGYHLSGIGKSLRDSGFKLKHRQWHTVY